MEHPVDAGGKSFWFYLAQPNPNAHPKNPFPAGSKEANDWDSGQDDAYYWFRFGD